MNLTTYKTAASTDHAAIVRIVRGMQELGWTCPAYHDSEERVKLLVTSPEHIADCLTETDMSTLYFAKGEHKGCILFVMGNEPFEVAADCSMSDAFTPDLEAVEVAINLEGAAPNRMQSVARVVIHPLSS